eukprot:SM000296S11294  [mRNA]  locus=s296:102870:107123:+ [translate_table: standard]
MQGAPQFSLQSSPRTSAFHQPPNFGGGSRLHLPRSLLLSPSATHLSLDTAGLYQQRKAAFGDRASLLRPSSYPSASCTMFHSQQQHRCSMAEDGVPWNAVSSRDLPLRRCNSATLERASFHHPYAHHPPGSCNCSASPTSCPGRSSRGFTTYMNDAVQCHSPISCFALPGEEQGQCETSHLRCEHRTAAVLGLSPASNLDLPMELAASPATLPMSRSYSAFPAPVTTSGAGAHDSQMVTAAVDLEEQQQLASPLTGSFTSSDNPRATVSRSSDDPLEDDDCCHDNSAVSATQYNHYLPRTNSTEITAEQLAQVFIFMANHSLAKQHWMRLLSLERLCTRAAGIVTTVFCSGCCIGRYFHMPITEASKELRVGLTVLKKRCRAFGIQRWPHRKMKSLECLITNIKELSKGPEGHTSDRVESAVKELESQRKRMADAPSVDLPDKTKRLRQACFKASYKRRRHASLSKNHAHAQESPAEADHLACSRRLAAASAPDLHIAEKQLLLVCALHASLPPGQHVPLSKKAWLPTLHKFQVKSSLVSAESLSVNSLTASTRFGGGDTVKVQANVRLSFKSNVGGRVAPPAEEEAAHSQQSSDEKLRLPR